MTVPASITRADVASLIAENYAGTIFDSARAGSSVLQAARTVNLGTKTTNVPVLATQAVAGWVGDTDNTGIKPVTKATWANKTIVAEEVAGIIAVHENTLADATENVLADLAAELGQAIGRVLDLAVLFGTNKPMTWTSPDLFDAAVNADQYFGVTTGENDEYGAHLIAAGALADSGYVPSTVISTIGLKYRLANLRGGDGYLVLTEDGLRGFDTVWNKNGAIDPADAYSFVIDPTKVVIGIRQDITIKILDQATLGTGADAINLAERDMVAIRAVARYGYVLGNGTTSVGTGMTPVAVVGPDHS